MMYNDDLKYIGGLGEAMRGLRGWKDIYEQQMNAMKMVSTLQPLVDQTAQYRRLVDSLVPKQVEMLKDFDITWNQELLTNTLSLQMDSISSALQCVQTESISSLLESFSQANWAMGMNDFVQSIESKLYTPASDLAFLRKNEGLEFFLEEGYPRGMKSFIRSVHKRTADRLATNENVEVSYKEKSFRSVNNASAGISVVGMNIVASSTELFAELQEDELLSFIDVLANEYAFSSEHPVGRTIWKIIREWDNFIDFDREYYYHGRAMKDNKFPYTSDEMGKAPNETVGNGRFNHMKQSHYYFSDSEQGARAEICKHKRNAEVQVARLRPKRSIKMIDLSEEIKNRNAFLEVLRIKASDSCRPTEYLLPEYLTTCCKKAGIEGIKYYGSKTYKNYVCWEDGYFDVDVCWKK